MKKTKMNKEIFSIFSWGVPKEKEVLKAQIKNRQYLHTCYDYGHSLSHIRDVSQMLKKPVNIISKIYLDYPDITSVRRLGLLSQVSRIYNFLNGNIENFVLQISSIPSKYNIKNYNTNSIANFLEITNKKYGVNKIFIESFPECEEVSFNLINELSAVRNKSNLTQNINFGLVSYENPFVKGFSFKALNFIETNNLLYMPMRVLGIDKTNKSRAKEIILRSTKKVLNEASYKNFFRAITTTSNLENYSELNKIASSFNNPIRKKSKIPRFKELDERKCATNPYGIIHSKNTLTFFSIFLTIAKKGKGIIKLILLKKNILSIFQTGFK